jgi:hypothetical protein
MARGIPMEMGAKGAPKKMSVEVEIEKNGGEMEDEPMGGAEGKILEMGREMDDTEEEAYGMAAPTGDFSVGGLNALVDGLNSVLPLFELPDYERFGDAVDTFPPKFVKQLTMVNEAANAAGLDDMVIDFSTLTDDRSLKMAAGKLRSLAGNTSFKRFLRSERPEAMPPEAPAPGGAPPPMAPPKGPSEDELMMSRLA